MIKVHGRRIIFFLLTMLFGIPQALGNDFINANAFSKAGLRGFVIGSTKFPALSDSDFGAMKSYGANLLRYFVIFKRCEGCLSYGLDSRTYINLDNTLAKASRNGMHVVITVAAEGDERSVLWEEPRLQDSFIETWALLAKRYKDHTTVAGYDLLNEPVPPGFTYAIRASTWQDFAKRLAKSIRVVDPNHTIIVQSAPDAVPTGFENLRPIGLDNVVYSFHFYLPMGLTHQNVLGNYKGNVEYPSTSLDRKSLSKSLDQVRKFAKTYSVPIFVGEFSCVRWAPKGSASNYIRDAIALFEAEGWPWVYHEFRGWPGWDAEITNDDPRGVRIPDAPTISILKRALSAPVKNGIAQ